MVSGCCPSQAIALINSSKYDILPHALVGELPLIRIPPDICCWRIHTESIVLYHKVDGQIMPRSKLDALVKDARLCRHVTHKAPGRLPGHRHAHRYRQNSTHYGRREELVLSTIEGNAMPCQDFSF